MARPKPSDPLVKVTVKMPESLVIKVDQLAESACESRSDVVRAAVEKFTDRKPK
jgi:metal-responsive CopG/Arc/MetJ family transcriptional regulator